MDGQMCEDIRIGILVRTELHGHQMWRRRAQFTADGIPGMFMNFSSFVLAEAGGIERFIVEWEREA